VGDTRALHAAPQMKSAATTKYNNRILHYFIEKRNRVKKERLPIRIEEVSISSTLKGARKS
jgi:hypothetical protein